MQGSPLSVNVAPLQVELLEKDLQDTKISLEEVKTQNQYLNEIVEQQKELVITNDMRNITYLFKLMWEGVYSLQTVEFGRGREDK